MKVALSIVLSLLSLATPFSRAANLITNGSFESTNVTLTANNGICASITGTSFRLCNATGWTGTYQIGLHTAIGPNTATFNVPQPDPDGSNALILQSFPGGTPIATQAISVATSGIYTLTFYLANRYSPEYANASAPQTIIVLVDGIAIPGATYNNLPLAWTRETIDLSLSAGTHSLSFAGLANTSAAATAFVDNVALNSPSPQAGLWWNPAEPGSGYAFDYKHDVLVVTVYSYTTTGAPLWYLASGPVTNNVFTSTLDKYQHGQCISCAYQAAAISGNDGNITITFTSTTTATMTLPGGRTFQIVPQAF